MRGFSFCCAIAALTLAGQAMAQDKLSYNKVDFGLVGTNVTIEGLEDLTGGGIDVSGSWEFAPHVFGFGELSAIGYSYDDEYIYTEGNFELGVGFNAPLASSLDVVAGLSWRTLVEIFDDYEDEEDALSWRGLGATVGLRGLIGRRVAWEAGLKYAKLKSNDYDSKFAITSAKAGLRFQFTRIFGFGVDVGINGYDSDFHVAADEVTVAAMFRFQFNDRDGSPQWK
jgi:hypothetical protein